MISAIIGDIAGSTFEWSIWWGNNLLHAQCIGYAVPPNRKDEAGARAISLPILGPDSAVTDDSICMLGVEQWLMDGGDLGENLRSLYFRYPDAGHGGLFVEWAKAQGKLPPRSIGNGAAMRVAPVAFAAESEDELLKLAAETAVVTHITDSPVIGAQAIALAVYLARKREDKEEIISKLQSRFGYDLSRSTAEWRKVPQAPDYKFSSACEMNVPPAIRAFYESETYEETIRRAISVGGDVDTIACMAGAIAGTYWGVPKQLYECALSYLEGEQLTLLHRFEKRFPESLVFA